MITGISHKRQLLSTIAVRASTPLERLQRMSIEEQGDFAIKPLRQEVDLQDCNNQNGLTHLQHLYSMLNVKDEEQKARFLAHFNTTEQQLIQAVSLSNSRQEVIEIFWVILLEHILSSDNQGLPLEQITRDRCLLPAFPMPFEELFLPFIRYGREQLLALIPDLAHLLSVPAQIELEHWLLRILASLASQPLALEFMDFRTFNEEASISFEMPSQQHILYDEFLKQYAGEDFLTFFANYSLLARLLIHSVEQWIEVCTEFLERLKADRDHFPHVFPSGETAGKVLSITTGCSDYHHHGRTVFILKFANGHKLVYKPRCMDIDEAFFRLITWFNEEGLTPDLLSPYVLNRNAYGWMEYIEHIPCKTSEEVHSYYQRCGLLLCLLYVLGSTDMHYENLIAHGTHPVPIDLETILSPTLPDPFSTSPEAEKTEPLSVLRSGMLTSKLKLQGQEIDCGAMGNMQAFDTPIPGPIWRNVNTDAMMLSYEVSRFNRPENVKVIHAGNTIKASDYLEDIVEGFRLMYHFLLEHRDDLLAHHKLLNLFADCPVRYVYRPTSIYAKQLLRLTSFEFLQDATTRWIDLQIFKKPLLQKQIDHRFWSIASAELTALERLDVPWFGTMTDSTHLYADEGIIIENVFPCSPLEQTGSCIAGLCDEDMEQQIKYIRETFMNM